ncbi:hypothetical protein KC367_g7659 [Hortaea werneckii]|nr:hypothetical protein KC342_g13715 [Hortaea werneckii]KAI7072154.1 hypothetical protein KC339_g14350 [Hortaea werneckii]KAI7224842.1 hypothetical protein KC365_g10385 [Hortaea werneckii]KAI7300186.1 hypothetical protein KC340_g13457 [Hortaea werneckii]KAI7361731.1 hypothetical protein KC354_g7843 [Hortaea werneckii]
MVSSFSRRTAFIDSLKRFLKQYVFDGVDISWEYPVAENGASNQPNYEKYVVFLKELRAELGTEYGVTATLPVSYRYLQHFDTKTLAEHLDWIHMQTYDLHGKLTFRTFGLSSSGFLLLTYVQERGTQKQQSPKA